MRRRPRPHPRARPVGVWHQRPSDAPTPLRASAVSHAGCLTGSSSATRASLAARLAPQRCGEYERPRSRHGRLAGWCTSQHQKSASNRSMLLTLRSMRAPMCQSAASKALHGCRAFVDVARPLPWVGHGSSGARASKTARPERPPCLQTPKSTIGHAPNLLPGDQVGNFRKKRTSGVELQTPEVQRSKFEVLKCVHGTLAFHQTRTYTPQTWSHEQSRAEVKRWFVQTFVQELWQLKVVGKTSSGGP